MRYICIMLDKNSSSEITPKNREDLIRLISETIKNDGPNCDLNFIDVSCLDDMRGVFSCPNQIFNGDISRWDVSNVKNMSHMFTASHFNGDISAWDVSQVQDMSNLFEKTSFNGDISHWNVSNVTNMSHMF